MAPQESLIEYFWFLARWLTQSQYPKVKTFKSFRSSGTISKGSNLTGGRSRIRKPLAPGIWRGVTVVLIGVAGVVLHGKAFAQQPTKASDTPITVHYTDIRKIAGITFLQDSTQTDQK